jgi:hypothetical protein
MLTTHQIKSAAALALALSAIGAPAATARMLPADPPQGSQTPTSLSPVVHVIAPNDGFDWGDAGIGAAGGFALSMLGLGTALTISQRRDRRPGGPSAMTS